MKLSNKILVGFLAFIFLYMTAAFAELRFTGSLNVLDNKNSTAETVDLSAITRLIVQDMGNRQVKVIGSDRAQLEVRSFKGSLLKNLKYQIANDALTISGFEGEENKPVRITVYIPEDRLKELSVTAAVVIIEGVQQHDLTISQNGSRIWMSESAIGKIETNLANRSFLDIGSTKLDTVTANIEASQVHISSSVSLLRGHIRNTSMVHVTDAQDIQVKKDVSSNLQIY